MQGGWMARTSETYANQYGYFKLTYDYGWGSLNAQTAYGYKGIMFWRWDASGTSSGGFDDAATIGASLLWLSCVDADCAMHACHWCGHCVQVQYLQSLP